MAHPLIFIERGFLFPVQKHNTIITFCYFLLTLLSVSVALTLLLFHLTTRSDVTIMTVRYLLMAELILMAVAVAVLFALRDYLAEISVKAFTDVTGVRDKKSLEKYLAQLQERSDTLDIGIMMFDLNGLKWINDNYGHERGDFFIQTFASCLTRILTANSFLARFGGDEFVIIQEHTSSEELEKMDGRLSKLIESYNRTASLPISYAVGWEVSYKNHYFLMDDLLRTADRNMYLDKSRKKQGRTNDPTPPLSTDSRHTVPVIAEDILAAKLRTLLDSDRSYLLFMNDIENFHFINDTYGYQMGNNILNAFFDAMNAESCTTFTCRYHSDIFVTIADMTGVEPDTALSIIQQRCRKIAEQLTERYPIGNCVINIGACQLDDPSIEPVEYISHANLARRTAKQDYGHICCYSEKMAQDEREHAQIIHSFPSALANEEFKLYFQPKIGSQSGKIESAEVLVRWQLADGTLRMPDTFIPLLEHTGDIVDLDFYIYDKAFTWLAEQQRNNTRTLPLSLNISPIHFSHPELLIRTVRELMQKYHVDPQNIIFEITERTYIKNTETVNRVIDEFHRDRIRISMDDFGSGYSSLSSLKDINFDEVKIDRAFIADGLTDTGMIVLQELFHILKRMRKNIVCEGVETDAVARFLRAEGCDEIQGFLYYRPMSQSSFTELLCRIV